MDIVWLIRHRRQRQLAELAAMQEAEGVQETIENVAVPMTTLEDGRQFITDQTVTEQPWVGDFIGRFSNYWQRHPHLSGWVSPEKEE